MKSKLITGIISLLAVAGLASCSSDGDGRDWEICGRYSVASFMRNGNECEAWYSPDGDWEMTETDYGESVESLPVLMQSAFRRLSYSKWFVDGVSLYDKPSDSFCEIEVVASGQPETSIFINAAGEVINIVPNYEGIITPLTDVALL